jgi:hypothetical protein
VRRSPSFLIHVPEGFYALAWPDNHGAEGYKHCHVAYDAPTSRFGCSNGARWALDGSVLAEPAPGYQPDPLEALVVRISLDNHLLVSPNIFMPDARVDLLLT